MKGSIVRSGYQVDEDVRRKVALATAALPLVLLAPFLVYRTAAADWPVAGLILGIMLTMVAVIVFLRHDGSAGVAIHLVISVYGTGAVAAGYALGLYGILWLYPVATAVFYCLPRRSASVVNALMLIAIAPVLGSDLHLGVRVVATLGLVMVFGWVFSRELESQRHQLSEMALLDTLTDTGNRRALELALAQVRDSSQRYGRPASLVILDLDRFKVINDEFGHGTGDEVLAQLASYLKERLRRSDRVFRFGGEEFVLMLPETPLDAAATLARTLLRGCGQLRLDPVANISFSAGVAELARDESTESWLRRADEALYRAKEEGRNRVVVADAPASG